ncbi:MAG: hypothetical protein M3071_24280 [Actinomycetota bacterium]|nr:hypothetical protein [Actinomycetota bacterium]
MAAPASAQAPTLSVQGTAADTAPPTLIQAPPPTQPSVTITGVTIDPDHRVVSVRFSATGHTSGFKCALAVNGKGPQVGDCRSPQVYTKLRPGVDHVTVVAVGPDGAPEAFATRKLTVPIEFSNCWGAASRDPEHRCGNRALKYAVVPTPSDALLIPLGYCGGEHKVGAISQCSFGVDPGEARATVALIGDSHAAAWLPAMQYVATDNRWAGIAYIHNGCPFSTALVIGPSSYASDCYTWAQAVTRWLVQHPEISTVVITGSDQRAFASSAEAGYEQAWQALPRSVHRIVIIRDVPRAVLGESDCVTRAIARHRVAGIGCTQPRSAVITPDLEADAALASGSPRVHLLDFTPFFCDSQRCFPVVGGVLVLKDLGHMTREFAVTLGPYLRRGIDALL